MPLYLYQHPETEEVKEILQGMNDEHVYEEAGVKWNRIFTVPQASIDAQIDPFSERQFMDKLGTKAGKVGEAWDRASEMSARRAAKAGGVDPVKDKYYKEYAKKRKGKEHPKAIIERANGTHTV